MALFSWGGGPASLALMQRETTAVGWVTPADFADAVALGDALPGPIAPQVSAFVGYKLAGVPVAIVAAAGTVLPTTILMLAMVAIFFSVRNAKPVQSMLMAVRPVVVGLLIWAAYDMAATVFGVKKVGWVAGLTGSWDKVLIALTSLISPIWIIVGAAVLGLVAYR